MTNIDSAIYLDLKNRCDRLAASDFPLAVSYLQLQYLVNFCFHHHLIDDKEFNYCLKVLHIPFDNHRLVPLGDEGSIFQALQGWHYDPTPCVQCSIIIFQKGG